MPFFDFTCMTTKGEWMKGRLEAPDINTLDEALFKDGFVLLTWAEVDPNAPLEAPKAISVEEGRMRWLKALASHRRMPKMAELAAFLPSLPSLGILDWIIDRTGGAIKTKGQAALLLLFFAGILYSSFHIAMNGLPRSMSKTPPLTLPAVTQPEMSEKKVKGIRRRKKTYSFKRVRADNVRKALDHVMRDATLSTQLAFGSENALTVSASPLDLELIDVLLSAVDQSYGDASEAQILMHMISTMARDRIKWQSVPHKAPEPTEQEKREDEIEKFISNS